MKKFDDALYVADMYADAYYPDFLVDKVKAALVKVVEYLEKGVYNSEGGIKEKFDNAMDEITNLRNEFEKHDSEIETVARDSIFVTVREIINHFDLTLDADTATGNLY